MSFPPPLPPPPSAYFEIQSKVLFSADYLVIKPIENYTCDMSTSYAKYWKHSLQGLDVGHRGLGTSFKQKR